MAEPPLHRLPPGARDEGAAGFMMIEVIVALAIVAMAFAYAFPSFSESLGRVGRDQTRIDALSVARSTLARVGHDIALRPGEVSGRSDEGFSWQVSTTPYDRVDVPARAGVAGFRVAVEVAWQERGRRRNVALSTLRLAYPAGGS